MVEYRETKCPAGGGPSGPTRLFTSLLIRGRGRLHTARLRGDGGLFVSALGIPSPLAPRPRWTGWTRYDAEKALPRCLLPRAFDVAGCRPSGGIHSANRCRLRFPLTGDIRRHR
jgi:hypothetical protein